NARPRYRISDAIAELSICKTYAVGVTAGIEVSANCVHRCVVHVSKWLKSWSSERRHAAVLFEREAIENTQPLADLIVQAPKGLGFTKRSREAAGQGSKRRWYGHGSERVLLDMLTIDKEEKPVLENRTAE